LNNPKGNIALLTTVANFELYKYTSGYFPKDIPLYVIDGRNGMHGIHSIFFMFETLKDRYIEWLIMADEDVIFQNEEEVFKLINFMKDNDYSVCGVRDGGEVAHRDKNPYAINTFFSVINFKKIQDYYNKKEILKNQYILENEFEDNLSILKYSFDSKSLFEPYYCFYFWLRRRGEKILFLPSSMKSDPKDQITNEVYNFNGKLILNHTWYARSYGNNEKHTNRINNILEQENLSSTEERISIIFKDKNYEIRYKFKKIIKRILVKLLHKK
tara:strand:+ start:957 stop:1769 length:813 start_codon:yes stop_codon:yes gene_type:complete